jgi:hypothetical protein
MDGRVTFDFFLGRGTKCDLPKGGRAVEIRYAYILLGRVPTGPGRRERAPGVANKEAALAGPG